MSEVLIIEDDPKIQEVMTEEVKDMGHLCHAVNSVEKAEVFLKVKNVDLVISDMILPGKNGDALITPLKQSITAPAIIIVTAFGSIDAAVECLKQGADDFLTKPLNLEHLCLSVQKQLEQRQINQEASFLRKVFNTRDFHGMIGPSAVMQKVFEEIKQIAKTSSSILIYGESGTGKELAAHALHAESSRHKAPFIAINCASIPSELLESEFFGHQEGSFTGASKNRKGLFFEANGGTLFLDEISEMPLKMQAKLLRVLQEKKVRPIGSSEEKEVDVHIIAATNQDLEKEVSEGRFREDLFFRLETFNIYLPPLRERGDDISVLIQHFFNDLKKTLNLESADGMSTEAFKVLQNYKYPGNVRELCNIMERSLTLCKTSNLQTQDLPEKLFKTDSSKFVSCNQHKTSSLEKNQYIDEANNNEVFFQVTEKQVLSLAEIEKRYLEYALEKCDGNKRRAAALLGIALYIAD